MIGLEQMPIFNFPAGANAGNFMHDVFEHLDFSDSSNWEKYISKKLEDHQYESKNGLPPFMEMVTEVMQTELEKDFP